MRASLLKSFFVVFVFWWVILSAVFFVAGGDYAVKVSGKINTLLPWAEIQVDRLFGVLDTLGLQKDIFIVWVFPVFLAGIMAVISGVFGAASVVVGMLILRRFWEKGRGSYRGIGVSLGFFPSPPTLPREEVKLKLSPSLAVAWKALKEPEQRLFLAGLETLYAHRDAYAGAGHGVGLLKHTLNAINRALNKSDRERLLILAILFHDIGKITAFRKIGDEYKVVRKHDKESARLLALFPEWQEMCKPDREALRLAIKYSHSPSLLPLPPDEPHYQQTIRLIEQIREADGLAVAQEKKRIIQKSDLPYLCVQAFLEGLAETPFHIKGMGRGRKGMAWRVGNRVYMMEHWAREHFYKLLEEDVQAALGGNQRPRNGMAEFTLYLLRGLAKKGWLITRIAEAKTPVDTALWNIRAGTHKFRAIIIVELPEEELFRLPSGESPYEVEVIGPLWDSGGNMYVSDGFNLSAVLH